MTESKEEKWQLLADCIRSDQLSAKQVYEELEADPEFKKWYQKKYLKADTKLRQKLFDL